MTGGGRPSRGSAAERAGPDARHSLPGSDMARCPGETSSSGCRAFVMGRRRGRPPAAKRGPDRPRRVARGRRPRLTRVRKVLTGGQPANRPSVRCRTSGVPAQRTRCRTSYRAASEWGECDRQSPPASGRKWVSALGSWGRRGVLVVSDCRAQPRPSLASRRLPSGLSAGRANTSPSFAIRPSLGSRPNPRCVGRDCLATRRTYPLRTALIISRSVRRWPLARTRSTTTAVADASSLLGLRRLDLCDPQIASRRMPGLDGSGRWSNLIAFAAHPVQSTTPQNTLTHRAATLAL